MYHKSKFRSNLYWLFVISLLVPILLETLSSTAYFNHKNIKFTKEQVQNLTDQISITVHAYHQDLENIASTPSLYTDILKTLTSFNRGYFLDDTILQNKLEDNYIHTFTKLLYTSINKIDSITFYPYNQSNPNTYQINKHYAGLQVIPNSNQQKNAIYKEAIQANGALIFTGFHKNPSSNTSSQFYSVLKLIKNFDTKKNVGILKIDVNADNILNMLNSISTTKHSAISLFNGSEFIYSNKPFDLSKEDYSIIYTDIPKSNWKIIYFLSQKDLMRSSRFVFLITGLLTLLSIFIAFFIFGIFSRKIVLSVNTIVAALRKIQGGDLTTRVTIPSDNEFQDIALAINQMTLDLDQHIKQEYLAVLEQKNAENRALQSQINPHFLYNTLNCLLALNRMKETQKVENAIINLTHLLRYTASHEKTDALEKEFHFIEKYIKLQQIRFEGRLFYTLALDDHCQYIPIPRLILQPIVENSIVHGMEPTDNPIHIHIEATYNPSNNLCSITISDDGLGFSPQLETENIGLSNIKKRLILWDPDVKFSITSHLNKGTTTRIEFKEVL